MEKETPLGVTTGGPGTRVGKDLEKLRRRKMGLSARENLGGEQRAHRSSSFTGQSWWTW